MQWLIDLVAARVIATIGIPPTFIDRGDTAVVDFTQVFFVYDGVWHDLDLSGIVPPEAVAVSFWVENFSANVGQFMKVRKKGNVNILNVFDQAVHTAMVSHTDEGTVPIGPDGMLEYFFPAPAYFFSAFIVKGWWL